MGDAPGCVREALDMVRAGLGYLAAAGPARLPAATQAGCLRELEQADAVLTAARAWFLWPVTLRSVLFAKNAVAYAFSLAIFLMLALHGGKRPENAKRRRVERCFSPARSKSPTRPVSNATAPSTPRPRRCSTSTATRTASAGS